MSNHKSLIFLLILFFLFPIQSQSQEQQQQHPSDIQALLEFKKGISIDPSGFISATWTSSASSRCPSTFFGISCNGPNGSVISISLAGLGLSGEVKLSTLSSLRSLRNLSLSGNSLSGRLVPVSSWKYVDISDNKFYGPIPEKITELFELNCLNLSNNNFSGGIPAGFENLQQLRTLDISSNGLSGDVGVLLSELRNVEHLDLSNNGFYGKLPVDMNNVSGLVSTLTYLNLSRNEIGGEFFAGDLLGVFENLEVLDLSDNGIGGELPSFDQVQRLKVLRARGNFLYGSIPGELFESAVPFEEIDLSGNGFTGSMQSINITTLKILNLSSNSLSGLLPTSTGSCISVDLSNNSLSGNLSAIQNWGQKLEVVDLSSNSLSGCIPDEISQFQSLVSMKIGSNSLEGALPSTIGNLPKLSVLDLSANKLTGSLLSALFMSSLTSLNLSGNSFSGPLPILGLHSTKTLTALSDFPLEILDLSDNQLSGSLPQEIGNFHRLEFLNLAENALSGELPSELCKLDRLEVLDLSINHFKGSIPDMNLPELKVFNVSYNDFSGDIPWGLQEFPESSFHPGNVFLLAPIAPTPENSLGSINNSTHRSHIKPSVRLAVIIGCVGALLLLFSLVAAFYVHRLQKYCTGNGFQNHANGGSRHNTPKPQHVSKSMNFSNELLLSSASRSMPSFDKSVVEGEQRGSPWKSSSGSVLSFSPQHAMPGISSPDRLVGELTILDSSLVLTVKELSSAPAEVLGRSSQGTSYKASLSSGHTLNVKWLRSGLVKHKKEFVKEARRLGAIRHPNIVSLRACCWESQKDERLLISDYVVGESLALHLYGSSESTPRRDSHLSAIQRRKVAVEIARALNYLHNDRGLCHGNLKPTNVILKLPDPIAWLTDCSLYCLMTANGVSNQILNLGALGYRAPEITSSKLNPTFKADVYSFGVILMEIITGKSAGDIMSGQSGAIDLPDWVQMCVREGRPADCFDKETIAGSEDASRLLEELLAVSLKCVLDMNQRPNIGSVLEDLSSMKF